KVRGIGNENADGNFDGGVVDRELELLDDEADRETDDDSTDAEVRETEDAVEEGKGLVADNRRDPELQREEAGGIVHEALAFDDVDDPARNAEPPRNRRRRDRVGRRTCRPQAPAG